ncbi:MAG: hypothetical protein ACLFQT_04065, partial [Thiohalophilus sp.]
MAVRENGSVSAVIALTGVSAAAHALATTLTLFHPSTVLHAPAAILALLHAPATVLALFHTPA